MVEQKIIKVDKTIDLKANNKKEFILIHGYTGSVTDFNELPKYLHKKFNANVKVICLKGHGTKIEDLKNLRYKDFLEQVENELNKELKKGMKVVLGGFSLGGQLALYLAGKYPVKGVFTISTPHKLKFPFNIRGVGKLGLIKKKWKKRIKEVEKKLRKESFHYTEMYACGLKIINKGKKQNKKMMKNISAPCLTIHSKKEPIGHYKSVKIIERKIKSKIKESFVFEAPNHNLFYSQDREEINNLIGNFFEKYDLFNSCKKPIESVAAIIPSYNESKRIAPVLKTLIETKAIKEIVVVDDGSKDDTEEVVRKFKGVRYVRNKINRGKGYSMERGSKLTKSPIIFFCDADLKNLTPEIVEDIARPVSNNEVDMFIGIRNNLMQKSFILFALNSGERALRREIWEKLPKYYKHRYRVEAGLNYFVKKYGKGIGWKVFSHCQTLKETKYGFWKGTFLRWWMNLDVLNAYISYAFIGKFRK
mgnify:CR=1 FL=1|tara:strand:+ start:674 stop:2101 length:1428 start_codon:yes stop_codon:yes gene_type:complete